MTTSVSFTKSGRTLYQASASVSSLNATAHLEVTPNGGGGGLKGMDALMRAFRCQDMTVR